MSNSTTNPPVPPSAPVPRLLDRQIRRAIVAELPVELRQLRHQVLVESMANGVPVRPDALCAVLAAHHDLADHPLTFTAAHVEELLWCGVKEFCDDVGLVLPDGCPEALHALLAAATARNLFDEHSDSVRDVFGAFGQLVAG